MKKSSNPRLGTRKQVFSGRKQLHSTHLMILPDLVWIYNSSKKLFQYFNLLGLNIHFIYISMILMFINSFFSYTQGHRFGQNVGGGFSASQRRGQKL